MAGGEGEGEYTEEDVEGESVGGVKTVCSWGLRLVEESGDAQREGLGECSLLQIGSGIHGWNDLANRLLPELAHAGPPMVNKSSPSSNFIYISPSTPRNLPPGARHN